MVNRGKRWLVAGALAMLSGCAGSPYYVTPTKKAFLPQLGEAQQLGERRITPDGIVAQTPVGWRQAARLDVPVNVSLVGKRFQFQPGDLLAEATVGGTASGQVPSGALVMCGEPRANLAKNLLSASTLGITSAFNRTGASAQPCLIDADRDGRVEKAILAGVKSAKDAVPVTITPAAYSSLTNQPMGGESTARILYRGKTGLVGGHVSFDLLVTEGGQPLPFDNVRTQVSLSKLPQRVMLMGTAFTVKSYNPADGSVLIEMERGFVEGEYGITTSYTTRYIPIYVPR